MFHPALIFHNGVTVNGIPRTLGQPILGVLCQIMLGHAHCVPHHSARLSPSLVPLISQRQWLPNGIMLGDRQVRLT